MQPVYDNDQQEMVVYCLCHSLTTVKDMQLTYPFLFLFENYCSLISVHNTTPERDSAARPSSM